MSPFADGLSRADEYVEIGVSTGGAAICTCWPPRARRAVGPRARTCMSAAPPTTPTGPWRSPASPAWGRRGQRDGIAVLCREPCTSSGTPWNAASMGCHAFRAQSLDHCLADRSPCPQGTRQVDPQLNRFPVAAVLTRMFEGPLFSKKVVHLSGRQVAIGIGTCNVQLDDPGTPGTCRPVDDVPDPCQPLLVCIQAEPQISRPHDGANLLITNLQRQRINFNDAGREAGVPRVPIPEPTVSKDFPLDRLLSPISASHAPYVPSGSSAMVAISASWPSAPFCGRAAARMRGDAVR